MEMKKFTLGILVLALIVYTPIVFSKLVGAYICPLNWAILSGCDLCNLDASGVPNEGYWISGALGLTVLILSLAVAIGLLILIFGLSYRIGEYIFDGPKNNKDEKD